MAPQVLGYPEDIDDVRAYFFRKNSILFENFKTFSDLDLQEMSEEELQQRLEVARRVLVTEITSSVDEWLGSLPSDAVVYEALVAISAGFNEVKFVPGLQIEWFFDSQKKEYALRVARAFYVENMMDRTSLRSAGLGLSGLQGEL